MEKEYVKKPIKVKAVQFLDNNKDRVYNWAKEIQNNIQHSWQNGEPCLIVPTLEGEMICSIGDFLIVEPFPTDWRKIYPCKPSIFLNTYQEVDSITPSPEDKQ